MFLECGFGVDGGSVFDFEIAFFECGFVVDDRVVMELEKYRDEIRMESGWDRDLIGIKSR